MLLFKFLFRNLKGYRFLVILAIIIAGAAVFSDIMAAMPLKFIPSKINNPGSDPACTFPFLDPVLSLFDTPALDPSLRPPVDARPGTILSPPQSQCPVSITDLKNAAAPQFTSHSVIGVIVFSIIWLIVFGVLSAGLAFLDLYIAAHIAQNLTARLRNQLFGHLQRLSLDWHGKQKKGDLVQRVTGNIADIEKLVTDGLVDLLSSILMLVGVAAIMIFISWQYTIIALAITPALFLIVLGYTRSIKSAAKSAAKAGGQVADVATEDMNALTVIKVFTREDREALRFGRRVGEHKAAGMRASGLQAQYTPLVSILVVLGTTMVIGIGGYVAAGNQFSIGSFIVPASTVDVGTLILFITYLKLLYQPMRDLSKLTNLASTASSGAERIQEVLDQAPEILDTQGAQPYTGPIKLQGNLSFENVFFGYTPERPVLKGINLQIPTGRKVALVGLSGGGKTSLVKLIPRFYEIQQGSVKVDGVDVRYYPLNVLRNNVSMVLQDSVLFEGSLRENIEVGRPGASMEDIVTAAKQADIHETIVTMLGGYDRVIREQGKDLSGGQRQRIAIARAILRDAPILILDEPTASLDVEAEAEVMRALDKLVVGRTVIMISHRLSTLGNVDDIVVLKDGQIAERGSFKELKRQGGIFAGLLDEQNRYNIERVGEKSILRSAFSVSPMPEPVYSYERRPQYPAPGGGPVTPPPGYPNASPAPVDRRSQMATVNADRNSTGNERILIEIDGKIVSERPLNKQLITIGRLSSNDVQVPNQRVSRLHAKLRRENGVWLIEDAESVNGLMYQGHRIERLALTNGDRIYLAPTAILHYKTSA